MSPSSKTTVSEPAPLAGAFTVVTATAAAAAVAAAHHTIVRRDMPSPVQSPSGRFRWVKPVYAAAALPHEDQDATLR